jgi:hypothetical protein
MEEKKLKQKQEIRAILCPELLQCSGGEEISRAKNR